MTCLWIAIIVILFSLWISFRFIRFEINVLFTVCVCRLRNVIILGVFGLGSSFRGLFSWAGFFTRGCILAIVTFSSTIKSPTRDFLEAFFSNSSVVKVKLIILPLCHYNLFSISSYVKVNFQVIQSFCSVQILWIPVLW